MFRTIFDLPPCPKKITHKDQVFVMGSCFSDMIGEKLHRGKFTVLANPFGVIYNPISLFALLKQSLAENEFSEELILEKDERYFHYHVHSAINATSPDSLLSLLRESRERVRECLSKASHVFITLGTSFVFELLKSKTTVANCHKQPSSLFSKRILEMEEIRMAFESYFHLQIKHNPGVKIILTVSPVRHIREGMVQNQISKSLLRLLCYHLERDFEEVLYFPSYELMMDDLRDYRFYKEDMIHPTETAENYIWEHFKNSYFDAETKEWLKKAENIRLALLHKPFNPQSASHKQFLERLLVKINGMPAYMDYSEELKAVNKQLET